MQPIIRSVTASLLLFIAMAAISTAAVRSAQTTGTDTPSQAILSPEDLYKKVLPSTMTLEVACKDGTSKTGTAFMAIKDGIAVTAWHVVNGAQRVTAKFSDGEQFDVSGLVDRDEARDVAIIHVKVFGRPSAAVSPMEPSVGAKAFVIGAPKGLDFSLSDGIVSQVRSIDGVREIQFSCAASPGNSGGPLLNTKGEVLGVVSWQVRDGQNLNFAIPSSYILALDASLPTQPWDSVKSMSAVAAVAPAPGGLRPTLSTDDFDKALGLATLDWLDNLAVDDAVFERAVRRNNGFRDGMPIDFYAITANGSKHLQELANSITADAPRIKLREGVLEALSNTLKSSTLLEKAVKSAQSAGGWNAAANDYLNQASAAMLLNDVTLNRSDWASLRASKAFAEVASRDTRIRLGVDDSPDLFSLGAAYYTRASLLLILVRKDSVADKIGLQYGDVLFGADNMAFADMMDFRSYLIHHAGQNITISLRRDNKSKTIDVKVPADVPHWK